MDSAAWTVPPAAVYGAPSTSGGAALSRSSGGSHASEPVLVWPTAGLPIVLPLDVFTATAQADFAQISGLLSVDRRVAALLADERRVPAFALASRDPRPLGAQGRLELELAAWAAREQAKLGLPATRGPVIVVGDDPRGSLAAEVRGALEDVRAVLAPLPWPRWAGPVVVYIGVEERGIPDSGVVRPALPMLQLSNGNGLRTQVASRIARLALDLSAPPTGGWPGWLSSGAAEVCRARAAGEGPSPLLMRQRRQAAGPAAISALLEAPTAERELSGALVQVLLTPTGQTHFSSLLDLLRQGASSAGAVRIAYGLSPQAW